MPIKNKKSSIRKNKIKRGVKNIKSQQKKCLKKRDCFFCKVFCLVRALIVVYPFRSLMGILLIVVGLLAVSLSDVNTENTIRNISQTSIVSQLRWDINAKKIAIAKRQKCLNTPWTPQEKDVCFGVIYNKTNPECAGLGGPDKIKTVGEAICCKDYDPEKMKACLGADIFLENIPKNSWQDISLVATEDDCQMGVKCQFYPDPAKYHAKVRESTGEYYKDDKGNIIIEKNCKPGVSVSKCNKECGGGTKTISTRLTNCTHVKTFESCNLQPCFTESVN